MVDTGDNDVAEEEARRGATAVEPHRGLMQFSTRARAAKAAAASDEVRRFDSEGPIPRAHDDALSNFSTTRRFFFLKYPAIPPCVPHSPPASTAMALNTLPPEIWLLIKDAIPLHLMTAEAFETYARSLKPGGLLLVHISNRHLDLEPVAAAIARRQGWSAALRDYDPPKEQPSGIMYTRSQWIMLSKDSDMYKHSRE